MTGFFQKYRLFFKYLISYLLVLIIPILILTFFINHTLLERIGQYFDEENRQSLRQFASGIDNTVLGLEAVRDSLLIQEGLDIPPNLSDVDGAKRVIKLLKNYTVSNPAISDIALYLPGDTYVYTSQGSYQIDNFFSGAFYYENWDRKEFEEELPKMQSGMVRPAGKARIAGKETEVMTVIYPVSYRGKRMLFLFLIDMAKLHPTDSSSAYLITDRNGALIYQFWPSDFSNDELSQEQWTRILENETAGEKRGKYTAFSMEKGRMDWQYIKIRQVSDVYGEIDFLKKRLLLLQLGLILSGGIIIWYSMVLNYKPLSHLRMFLQKFEKLDHGHGIKDIRNSVEKLVTENLELRGENKTAGKEHFLYQLIKGRIESQEEFLKKTEQFRLSLLNQGCFFVLILIIKPMAKTDGYPVLKEEDLQRILPGYLREEGECGKYIYIGTLEEPVQSHLTRLVMDLQNELQNMLEAHVLIAYSGLLEGYETVPQCYIDAMLAADYRFIRGYDCVIDSTMVILNGEIGIAYPRHLFEKLSFRINSGDADKILEVLNEIIDYIKQSNMPLYYAKGLCYQLIHNISAFIDKLNQELPGQRNKLSYATVLADFDTVDDLIEAVRNISLNICDYIRSSKIGEKSRQLEEMTTYIEARALHADFSIQNMAADFSMSFPALSTFFKNQYGVTLSDYVARFRMKEALRLITEENMAVQKAAESVGYISTSSFIRKFKAIYGLTPGQYVKQYGKKEIQNDHTIL